MNDYRVGVGDHVPALARTFFATFSRFEFALKRGGFAAGEIGKAASANWDKFAEKLDEGGFLKKIEAAPQAAIFFTRPPKRLTVIVGGEVDFEEMAVAVNAQQLLEAVRRVRNNLFHGEKTYIDDRDKDLMTAGLFVLDSAFEAAMQTTDCDRMTIAFAFAPVGRH
ncbi:MAG: hypothetical protein WEB63_06345 [Cucumibacter sp.]